MIQEIAKARETYSPGHRQALFDGAPGLWEENRTWFDTLAGRGTSSRTSSWATSTNIRWDGRCLDADNTWFTLLTQNTAAPHVDHHYAAQTEFGRPLVNSTFTFALVNGQSVNDISYNVIANLGWDEVRLPNPVFSGDTIYSRSEILDTRESRSRAEAGIVTVRTTGFNHEGVEVISFKRTVMVYRRARRPSTPRLEPPDTA